MNNVKEFCKRGLMFSGLGPIVAGIVFMILGLCGVSIELEGWQIFLAIFSTYLIAFVQAGSTVFEQIQEWSTIKGLFIHMFSIYAVYLLAYLVNGWIPFNYLVVIIFSASFIGGFLIIWLIIYLTINATKKNLNKAIKYRR